MNTRPNAFVVNRVSKVSLTCGHVVWLPYPQMAVALLLSVIVNVITVSGGLAADDSDENDAAPVVGERQFVITEQQFDQMVFGGQQMVQRAVVVPQANGAQALEVVQNMVVQTSVPDFRKRMEATAVAEIDVIDRRVSLTDGQKKKLKLAARGDIEQHVTRAVELRPKLTSKPMNQQQYVELMRELQPLRMTQQFGIIGENSLFRKTLRHTLTNEQRLQWQTVERERQRVVIETAIQTWERTTKKVSLWGESRQKFIDVLLDFGDLPETRNSYIHYVVLVEVGRLEDRLKPIVSEEVWENLQKQITQAKQIEATLRRSGQWPARAADDDDGLADSTKE